MQRYFAKKEENNNFILEDSDYHHIKNVMRMKINEEVEVVYNNELYIGKIENLDPVIILNQKKLNRKKENKPEITLYIPLVKEQKMDYILQKATELGVDNIVPIEVERSIIKLTEDKYLKKRQRWQKICKEASEQSKRITIPNIGLLQSLDNLKSEKGVKLVCSTQEKTKNLKNIVKSNKYCDKISVVIGPEGGLSLEEEKTLQNYGFIPVTLGSRIMRVETVPLFILSAINYEYME